MKIDLKITLVIICIMFIGTATANTIFSDDGIIIFGEQLTKDATITVGKSGAVDYLTSDYATDDACIQAVLNNANSGDTIIIREGEYNIVNQISQQNKDLNIIGSGDVLFNINTGVENEPAFYFYGTEVDSKNLASSASKGDTTIVLIDASKVQQFDLIKIWKDVQWCPDDYPQQKTGEMYVVDSVSGNTVTLNQPLIRDYYISDISRTNIYRPVSITIDNLKFQNADSTGDLEGLALKYCKDSIISNSWFNDNGQASIRLFTCYNVDINNNYIRDSSRNGRGYGISIADASASIKIHDNQIENCRHAIMSGTGQYNALNRGIIISNNILVGSSVTDANVIDAHPMAIDYTVTGNTIYPHSNLNAFYDGTLDSVFSDNYVYGGGGVKRRGNIDNGQHIIANNHVEGGNLYHGGGTGVGKSLTITGNYNFDSDYGMYLNSEDYQTIVINGNTFNKQSENGINLVMQSSTTETMNVVISNNIIKDAQKNGMYLKQNSASNTMYLNVDGNIINNVNIANDFYNGITLLDVSNANLHGNQIFDDNGNMYYGIREYSLSNWNYIHDNMIKGGTGHIQVVGVNTIARDNIEQ